MSFGPARGIGWLAFQKLVKRLTYVVIRGEKRYEVDLPLEFYNVPIFQIQVELPKDA